MIPQTQAAEEWLSTKVGALRTTLAKVFLGIWTLVLPLLLLWSGLSTANKILAYTLWVSVILNSLLLAVVCWHRTENRRRLADQAKIPALPDLDQKDFGNLRYLVAQNLGCGVDRIASYTGDPPFLVAHSMDKLGAHGYVENTKEFTSMVAEYRATAKGRDRCINPSKH